MSSRRRNAGDGADWGPEGEQAYELEVAVRDALNDVTLGTDDPAVIDIRKALSKRDAVTSSYSPKARDFLVRRRTMGIALERFKPSYRSVFAFFPVYAVVNESRLTEVLDRALVELNRNWSTADTEWWWDVLDPNDAPLTIELSRGRRPWRWKRKPFFTLTQISSPGGKTSGFRDMGRWDEGHSGAIFDVAGGGRLSFQDALSQLEIDLVNGEDEWLEQNQEAIEESGADPRAAFLAWVDGYLGASQRHRREIDRRHREDPRQHGLDNPPRMYRPQKVVAKLEKETKPSFLERGMVADNPNDIAFAMADYIGDRAHEYFVSLFVNVRNQIIGYTENTNGGTSAVEVDTSGLMREALGAGAAAIITVHQHPSGDATPSDEDRLLWKRLREAGKIVGVPILDNMVIGETDYFSEMQGSRVPIPRELRRSSRRAAER